MAGWILEAPLAVLWLSNGVILLAAASVQIFINFWNGKYRYEIVSTHQLQSNMITSIILKALQEALSVIKLLLTWTEEP